MIINEHNEKIDSISAPISDKLYDLILTSGKPITYYEKKYNCIIILTRGYMIFSKPQDKTWYILNYE